MTAGSLRVVGGALGGVGFGWLGGEGGEGGKEVGEAAYDFVTTFRWE